MSQSLVEERKTFSQEKKKRLFIIFLAFMALGVGYFFYRSYFYISTDDAQVHAKTVMISAKVSGFIIQVNVEENQSVRAGDILAQVDRRDYLNKLNQVENEMNSVSARVSDDERNFKRLQSLFQKRAVSQQQHDNALAVYQEGSRRLKALQAQVDQAQLNLDYTQIKAPSDGFIARKSAEVGVLASVGMPLFGFVSAKERWIEANFKETDLKPMRVGNEVVVSVDALPQRKFHGRVHSISPATGATFTLLPPDNATGNFTKVVQRVPVRINLDELSVEDIESLRAGLSAFVSVRVR